MGKMIEEGSEELVKWWRLGRLLESSSFALAVVVILKPLKLLTPLQEISHRLSAARRCA
jgi:hypothetical protein